MDTLKIILVFVCTFQMGFLAAWWVVMLHVKKTCAMKIESAQTAAELPDVDAEWAVSDKLRRFATIVMAAIFIGFVVVMFGG